jgi:hypothetical protein
MALQYLLMAAQAGKMLYGLNRSRRAERETMQEFGRAESHLNEQGAYVNQGAELDQKMLDVQMQQTRLASTEQSLVNTEQLRYNLSSQRALFAARGQNPGQGPAQAATQASLRGFGREETARRLNLGYAELTNKGQKALTEINRGYELAEIGNKKAMLGSESRNIRSEARRGRRETVLGTLANIGSMNLDDFGDNNKKRQSKGKGTLFSGYEEIFK